MSITLSSRYKYLVSLILALGYLSWLATASANDNTEQPPAVKHLNAADAQALLKARPDIQILDVRTKSEYKRGHIDGAILNNYFSFKFKKRLRALDRTTPYLVHCKSGHRSSGAVKIMQSESFQNIYHLDGGYDAWKKLTLKP